MNVNEIIQLRLSKNDFLKLPSKEYYKLVFLDKTNYKEKIDDINIIMSLIKTDIPNWDESPNFNDVIKRFESNSHCLLFYYNDNCIGWNWGNENVCINWINKFQNLLDGELYAGGCFVSKSVNKPPDAGRYNYNMICDYWLNNMGYTTIYGYVDIWNKPAIRINLQTGVKFVNYLKI
jgi:hypothetical protein